MNINFKIIALLLITLLLSTPAGAHLRWFVDIDSPNAIAYQKAFARFEFDMIYFVLLAAAVAFAVFAITVDNLSRRNEFVGRLLNTPLKLPVYLEWRLISIALGMMMLLNSHHGVLLAPNLPTSGEFIFQAALILQFIVGLLFVSQLSFVLSAIGTFCLTVIIAIITPPSVMIDYIFEFGGIIIAFYFIGPSMCRLDRILWPAASKRNDQIAVAALAMALGLQLAELAVHNKLLNPGLALIFIDDNGYLNFMRMVGLDSFKNIYFVFAAGIAELTLGTLLVFGIATRMIALGIGVIFAITSVIFGLHELLGHIPIMGVVLLIVLNGRGTGFISLLRTDLLAKMSR